MKNKRIFALLLAMILMLSGLNVAYADYVYTLYDFEDFTNSTVGMPSGTTFGGYISSDSSSPVSGRYMCLQNASSYIAVNISSLTASGSSEVLLSSNVRIKNPGTSAKLFGASTSSGGTANGSYISFTNDQRIVVCKGAPATEEWDLATYNNSVWYKVEVLIDTVNQKADIFLDGTLIGDDVDWVWSSGYTWLVMRPTVTGEENYSLRLDNIMYTDDPQYFPTTPFYQLFDFTDCTGIKSGTPYIDPVSGNKLTQWGGTMTAQGDSNKYLGFNAGAGFLIYPLSDEFKEAKGKLLLSTDIRIDDAAAGAYLFGFSKNSNLNSHIEFTAEQKITAGKSTMTELGTYTNNKWYNISVLIDKSAKTADIFLDGKLIGDDITWDWPASSYDRVHVRAMSGGSNNKVMIDNLMYTNNPTYYPMYLKTASLGSALSEGANTVDVNITNESLTTQPIILLTAVYKDTEENCVAFSKQEATIKPLRETAISAGITIPAGTGYFVKAFLWDDIEHINPIFDCTEFTE